MNSPAGSQPSSQPARLAAGGRIDRSTELAFEVDGIGYTGHPGDTLASALLAAGRIEVGNRPEPFPVPAVVTARLSDGADTSGTIGAYVNVVFAKLAKTDDN